MEDPSLSGEKVGCCCAAKCTGVHEGRVLLQDLEKEVRACLEAHTPSIELRGLHVPHSH